MVILVDAEGQKAITELCDVALRAGGIQNLKGIQQILTTTKRLGEPKPEPAEDSQAKCKCKPECKGECKKSQGGEA